MIIRPEESKDYQAVFDLIEKAFENEELSDHKEQYLVKRLRKSDSFIPELSLIAEIDKKIVGHILFTGIQIINDKKRHTSLALAPVSVLPTFQNQGIGEKLIKAGHDKARKLGYDSIVLLGHEKYYPRFGYQPAKHFGIKLPFEAPDENCMVFELSENALKHISGIVEYPKEFME